MLEIETMLKSWQMQDRSKIIFSIIFSTQMTADISLNIIYKTDNNKIPDQIMTLNVHFIDPRK